jgi:hypothetical protein
MSDTNCIKWLNSIERELIGDSKRGPTWPPSVVKSEISMLETFNPILIADRYCGRGKGIPNGWSFNWNGMATRERAGLETRCVESLLVVYLCLLAISSRCQKTVPPLVRG